MTFDFTIIVPIYNEEDCLPKLFTHLDNYVRRASIRTCLLLVDDGSTDKSAALIEEFCQGKNYCSSLIFEKNYGKGAALKAGFDITKTSLLGYMDADLQTRPEDFELLLPFASEYELVTGWRKTRKDTGFKKLSSKTGNYIRNLFTRDSIHDSGCPLKIIKTTTAKKIPMFRGLQRFLPAMVLLQNKKIKEVEIPHYPRIAGTSKYSLKNRFLGPLVDCFAYLWMKKTYINYRLKQQDE